MLNKYVLLWQNQKSSHLWCDNTF